jgi:hypothetical protein
VNIKKLIPDTAWLLFSLFILGVAIIGQSIMNNNYFIFFMVAVIVAFAYALDTIDNVPEKVTNATS